MLHFFALLSHLVRCRSATRTYPVEPNTRKDLVRLRPIQRFKWLLLGRAVYEIKWMVEAAVIIASPHQLRSIIMYYIVYRAISTRIRSILIAKPFCYGLYVTRVRWIIPWIAYSLLKRLFVHSPILSSNTTDRATHLRLHIGIKRLKPLQTWSFMLASIYRQIGCSRLWMRVRIKPHPSSSGLLVP